MARVLVAQHKDWTQGTTANLAVSKASLHISSSLIDIVISRLFNPCHDLKCENTSYELLWVLWWCPPLFPAERNASSSASKPQPFISNTVDAMCSWAAVLVGVFLNPGESQDSMFALASSLYAELSKANSIPAVAFLKDAGISLHFQLLPCESECMHLPKCQTIPCWVFSVAIKMKRGS